MLKKTLIAAGLCIAVGSAAWALNQEKEHEHDEAVEEVVKLAETPAAVQSVLKKAAGSATIDEIQVETEDGITIYEASWKVRGIEHEISVDATGQVFETEHVVSGDAVPKAVRTAATKHLPKGAKAEFEMKSIVLYSAEATVNGKEYEILVDPVGRRIELEADGEQEHGEHGDHNDDDDDDDDDENQEDDD